MPGNLLDLQKMQPPLIPCDLMKCLTMRRLEADLNSQIFRNWSNVVDYLHTRIEILKRAFQCYCNFRLFPQVVRCNYTLQERKATVELISYIKGLGTMMERVDTLVADSMWEVLHAQVQEFVQNKVAIMLRTTFKKKKDLSR